MLYLDKDTVYVKANNKFYKVEYKNNELKATSEKKYSIDDSNVIPYEKAIKILGNKGSKTFKIEKEDI